MKDIRRPRKIRPALETLDTRVVPVVLTTFSTPFPTAVATAASPIFTNNATFTPFTMSNFGLNTAATNSLNPFVNNLATGFRPFFNSFGNSGSTLLNTGSGAINPVLSQFAPGSTFGTPGFGTPGLGTPGLGTTLGGSLVNGSNAFGTTAISPFTSAFTNAGVLPATNTVLNTTGFSVPASNGFAFNPLVNAPFGTLPNQAGLSTFSSSPAFTTNASLGRTVVPSAFANTGVSAANGFVPTSPFTFNAQTAAPFTPLPNQAGLSLFSSSPSFATVASTGSTVTPSAFSGFSGFSGF
jgi:hypothetical protein